MAELQSFEDLKVENAAEELNPENAPKADEEIKEPEAGTEETESTGTDSDPTPEGDKDESLAATSEEPELEDWMKPDGHTSEAEKKYTGSDIGKAKAKVKAKLKRSTDENEQLKARISELENSSGTPTSKPKEDDFLDSDDPTGAYSEALMDWKIQDSNSKRKAETASQELDEKQRKIKVKTDAAVDQHYTEAVKLSEEVGISAEAYHAADLNVREMIDSLYPGSGDVITDAFIASLGKGSAKVFYSLGINAERREKFKTLLQDDTSGIAAGVYLGGLKKDLTATKRKSTAPAPADDIKAEGKIIKPGQAQKNYDAAHKKGDFNLAYNIKADAKEAGVDTKQW